jgi:type IV secretion system protein VirD4
METPNWLKWLFLSVMFIAATIGVIFLSGFLFFLFSKANPLGKTDLSTWWTYWQFYSHNPVVSKNLILSLMLAAICGYFFPAVVAISAMDDFRSQHGDARFANEREVAKAGLFGNTGIILGKWGKKFLMFGGMQFVLLMAPTRSKKGVGIVIPNLLNWSDSVTVLDVKLENFLITSKFRAKHGQEVYLFNPFCITEDAAGNPLYGKTHRYNPLGYISDDPRLRITDILAIGYSLYPGEGREAFFDDAARNLFLGLTLYICETPNIPRTMGELLRQSSGKGQPIKTYIQKIVNERNFREFHTVTIVEVDDNKKAVVQALLEKARDSASITEGEALKSLFKIRLPKVQAERLLEKLTITGAKVTVETELVPLSKWDGIGSPPLSMECVDALNRFTSTSDNTLSSIVATFNVPLTIWASPIVDAATSANDFDLRDVRKKRMSIYLGIPANKLAESRLLLNLFYTQLVNLNTNQLLYSTPELKYFCLMLNDEFTAPGRIAIIDKANAYMAGYGLRMLTIAQSPGQIEAPAPKGYGREGARTLMTNHACQILYTPREQRDANEYSEALGYYGFKSKSVSRQFSNHVGHSESESEQKRALMLPQELKEMSLDKEIISLENTKPIMADKISYYSDHIFINRLKSISLSLAQLGRELPTKKQLEDIWSRGELASPVPSLDLDLHQAIVEARIREMTLSDVANGIDLRKLALDTSALDTMTGSDGLAPEQVESFVSSFFEALDAVNQYDEGIGEDGSGTRPSDDELTALDDAAKNEQGDIFQDIDEVEEFDALLNEIEYVEDYETTTRFKEVGVGHDQDNAETVVNTKQMIKAKTALALDLSVLDKPLSSMKNVS